MVIPMTSLLIVDYVPSCWLRANSVGDLEFLELCFYGKVDVDVMAGMDHTLPP